VTERRERVVVAGPEVLLSQLALSGLADCTYFAERPKAFIRLDVRAG